MNALTLLCVLAALAAAYSLSVVPNPMPETCPEAEGIITTCQDVGIQFLECSSNKDCEPDERCCSYGCGQRTKCFKKKPDNELPTCWQSEDPGSCPRYQYQIPVLRWFYDKEGGRRCRQFKYSGCGGNENNFKTYRECIFTCGNRYRPSLPRKPWDPVPSMVA